jgi:hypothetical protein
MEKHFEVRTGKNRGFYIVTKAKHLMNDDEEYKYLANVWGMLVYEYNSGFYKYHHINPNTEVAWTHSHFAGHEFTRKHYKEMIKHLGCNETF